MGQAADQPVKPPRAWRPMLLWSAGILLVLGLVWFVAAVVVPVWQTHKEIQNFKSSNVVVEALLAHLRSQPDESAPGEAHGAAREAAILWLLRHNNGVPEAIDRLGGPDGAAGRLRTYLRMPQSFCPEKKVAIRLLYFCGEAGATVLLEAARCPDPELQALAAQIIEIREIRRTPPSDKKAPELRSIGIPAEGTDIQDSP